MKATSKSRPQEDLAPVNRSTVRFTIIGVGLDSFGLEIEMI